MARYLLNRVVPLKRSDRDIFKADNTLEMLESILDSMGVGVFVCDRDGYMLYSNDSSSKILGYKLLDLPFEERVKLIGNYLSDGETPFPSQDLPIAKAIRGEETDDLEYVIRNPRRPQGVRVSVSGRPLRDRNDKIIGGVLVQRDVTKQRQQEEETKKLEEQLQRAQILESLGMMVGGVAHDYNNLLMGILGNIDLVITNTPGDKDARLDQIKVSAQRLAELTQQLLAFAGKRTRSRESINLAELVQEMTGLISPTLPAGIDLSLEIIPGLPPIHADAVQFRQVLTNLITNAADAIGGEKGTLRIRLYSMELLESEINTLYFKHGISPGRVLCLSVEDSGCGMSPELISRIFEPFFTTKMTGHGLGLASTVGILNRHGYGLRIDSEVGIGTTFTVYIPPIQESDRISVSTDRTATLPARHVFFVDDDPLVLEVTISMLESLKLKVSSANGGQRALELIGTHGSDYDFFIIDLNMPDVSGLQVLHAIRKLFPNKPIIISSGDAETGITLTNTVPHTYFLAKPYTTKDLEAKIKEVV